MKRKIAIAVTAAAFTAVFSSLLPGIFSENIQRIEKTKGLANRIFGVISGDIENPIAISKAIGADFFLAETLQNEAKDDSNKDEIEQKFAKYLSSIKNKFRLDSAFIVSDKTHRYYTEKRILKIVAPKNEPYDIWYQIFVDSKKEIDLDPDRDQQNDYHWTLFIKSRIEDENGNLLGVCGIGILIENLLKIISKIEKEQGVKVNLVNREGLILVDTDSANIKNAYIPEAILDEAGPAEFTYKTRSNGGFRMTRYLPNFECFIVVQNVNPVNASSNKKMLALLLYALFAMILFLSFFKNDSKKKNIEDLGEDPLTHLPNRTYLKNAFGELGIFNTTRYKSLAMIDIDRFNIEIELKNGDEIIKEVARITQELVGEQGIIFRWSRDEFVVFLEISAEEAEIQFRDFCKNVQDNVSVTVSVGIVQVDLSESIKTNYHRAVEQCYALKAAGGNGVRRQV